MKLLGGKRSAPAVRLSGPGLFSGACLSGRAAAAESAHVPLLCVRSRRKPCIQSWRRASIGFMSRVADGRWGFYLKGLAGRPHGRVPPVRPSVPATAGAEEPINPCPQGRGSTSSWRVCVWGSGTDARVHCLSLRGVRPSSGGLVMLAERR